MELQANAEHEQDDADLSQLLRVLAIGHEPWRVRTDDDAGDEITGDRGESDPLGEVAEHQRGRQPAGQGQDQSAVWHIAIVVDGELNARKAAVAKKVGPPGGHHDRPAEAGPYGVTRSAAPFVPKTTSIRALNAAAHDCRGCDLYKHATQVVFGAGPKRGRVMFVGEQPGDQEDRQGEPFVGPAGALLDKALADAGIPREAVYLTNAVKHFKWEPRGKRRIHKKPRLSEVKACRPWLEAELRAVKPELVVCLGATAAQSVLGSQFKLMAQRGQLLSSELAGKVMATIHPSAVIRARDAEGRQAAYEMLVGDLKVAAKAL